MKGKFNLLALSAILVAGCQSSVVDEQPVAAASLAPFAEPTSRVGDVCRYVNESGEQLEDEVTAIEGDVVTWRDSRGCTYASPGYFSPSAWWKDCADYSNGTQQAQRQGNIFPLEVGSSESWEFSGSDASGSWSSTRNCEVDSITRVSVPAGSFDAYKVVCNDQWRERTWYVSPEAGTTVLYTNRKKRGGVTTRSELVAWMPAAS